MDGFAERRESRLSRHLWTALALLCLGFALSGCGGLSRYELASVAQPAPARPSHAVPSTPASDRENTRILATYGGAYNDPRLEALVAKTVDRLVAVSGHPDHGYKVTILNSGAVNAFALPTGQLYVTRGLLALADDNSELSSVLAHEMAHVIFHHAALRAAKARQLAVVNRVVTDMSDDTQLTALALAKSKLTLATFSQQQELQADSMGVKMSARAHFDPYGAARFLTSMERNEELTATGKASSDSQAPDFLSSHPATPERVQKVEALARRYASPETKERDHEAYLSAIDGLVYGDDPSEGFVRGRRFLHPKLGFTFEAPEHFTLDNAAQAVVGVRDGGGQAIRFDVVRVPGDQSLGSYLGSGWMQNVDKASIKTMTINGFPAASATAHNDPWQFKIYVLRFGTDVYRFIFATTRKTTESERNARDTVKSFRRLTLREIRDARPLRVKVITVQPGDTVESLSHRMVGMDHPVQLFRVLNGLGPHAEIKVRERVKVVVE